MGRTARFDQIYVGNLDADPREQDVLQGINSILTSEINADDITTGNLTVTNIVSITADMSVEQPMSTTTLRSNNFGIGVPTNEEVGHEFVIGSNIIVGNTSQTHVFTVLGNVHTTNVIASNLIKLDNDTFLVDSEGANVLSITGNSYVDNVYTRGTLTVARPSYDGSNILTVRNGNVYIDEGILTVNGNIRCLGNLHVAEDLVYNFVENLIVANVAISMADGSQFAEYDCGIFFTVDKGVKSNAVIGYLADENEFKFGKSFQSAYELGKVGSEDLTLDTNTANAVNVHVLGRFFTDSNVGVANTNPSHTMCVGANVYFEETGSNVIHSSGNVFTEKLSVGSNVYIGDTIQLHNEANVQSNVVAYGVRTTGDNTSGISNTAPTDDLSIGSKIFANLISSNTLVIVGNTVSTNVQTNSIINDSNIVIHAHSTGPDSTSNVLFLKSGPLEANVSSIEIHGSNTNSGHQSIRFKTKNTERVRIASNGYVGISNTFPDEVVTVGGNVHATGQSGFIAGNTWGTAGETSMRIYSQNTGGQNKIENIVDTGKGLNFYVSKTATMGSPILTILETSNVGIGTTQPQGRFQTSGGTAFINPQVVQRGTYSHLGTPLVVSNTSVVSGINDMKDVLTLAREGTASLDGVRATMKLGKHGSTTGASETKLDIYLASSAYETENDVLTLQSDGRVGIGSTVPEAFLEVISSGIGNARQNSLMVHNHGASAGDAIVCAQTDTLAGNAFSSYVQSDQDSNPRGWSVGVSGATDFRITKNIDEVSQSSSVGLILTGADNFCGIGTDQPREALEVAGNVVIGGNRLDFGGLLGDEHSNTVFLERLYGTLFTKNELVIYKGNDGSGDAGPDRIRSIAGQHVWQTYTATGGVIEDVLTEPSNSTFPLSIYDNVVVINGNQGDAEAAGTNTKLVVNGEIEFGAGGQFTLQGLQFLTTEVGSPTQNIIRTRDDGGVPRPLSFRNEDNDVYMIFDTSGKLGIGTDTVSSNVTIYSGSSGDIDTMTILSPGTNKENRINLHLNSGEGGYMAAFSNTTAGNQGFILGTTTGSTKSPLMHLVGGNVGFGNLNKPTANITCRSIITNVGGVECKRYSTTFLRTSGQNANTQIFFSQRSFFAKIILQLRETSNRDNISTMIIECHGGVNDATNNTSTVDIAIGSSSVFGGTNSYPWSTTIYKAKRGLVVAPNTSARNYNIDVFVELTTANSGKLSGVYAGASTSTPDSTGDLIQSFDY